MPNLPGRHEAPPGPSTVPTQAHWWTRENWSFSLAFWQSACHTERSTAKRVTFLPRLSWGQSHVTFSLFPENELIVSRAFSEWSNRFSRRPRGPCFFAWRGKSREPWTGIRKHGGIASSCRLMSVENSNCSFKRTRSECYTGAIMTVPPELPPGTLRCSAFLVGMDRTAAAIPFSSDVACYPCIHVSESGDEPADISRDCCARPALCTCRIVRVENGFIDVPGEF